MFRPCSSMRRGVGSARFVFVWTHSRYNLCVVVRLSDNRPLGVSHLLMNFVTIYLIVNN